MSQDDLASPVPPTFDYIRSTVISDKSGQVLFRGQQYMCPIGRGAHPSY